MAIISSSSPNPTSSNPKKTQSDHPSTSAVQQETENREVHRLSNPPGQNNVQRQIQVPIHPPYIYDNLSTQKSPSPYSQVLEQV